MWVNRTYALVSNGLTIDVAVRLLARQRLVLADGECRRRGEMGRYLRSVGVEVREAGTLAEAVEAVRDSGPAVLVLDIDIPGAESPAELVRAVRFAAERRVVVPASDDRAALPFQPGRTMVLYTCSAYTSRKRLLALLTPEISGVIVVPCRPELLILRVASLLDRTSSATSAGGSAVTVAPGNSSLLQHRVLCPYHDKPVEARRFSLRMGKMEASVNFFDIPVYTRPVGNAEPVDFHRVGVTVCPVCLFASVEAGAFLPVAVHGRSAPRASSGAALSPTARLAVMSSARERRELAGALDESFFSESRSAPEAVVAHRLAIESTRTLLEAGVWNPAEASLRLANGHLRLAHVRESAGEPELAGTNIEHASRQLREAFATLPEPAIPRAVYQVVATGIYLHQDRDIHPYLSQLSKRKNSFRDPANRQLAERYLTRSMRAWEEREQHRRPVVPGVEVSDSPALACGVPFIQRAA